MKRMNYSNYFIVTLLILLTLLVDVKGEVYAASAEIQITGKLKETELNPFRPALPDKSKDKTIPEYKQTIIKEDLPGTGEVFSMKVLMIGFLVLVLFLLINVRLYKKKAE
ncbi:MULTISPECIES: hypothetical protein [unclassified Enterococcus]|uniref:hypothetical protein n=1 Tax=unclassified Enterococcus TaxID=2608891 RepID=UPI001CE1166F|nr:MULTISPECIES: hypothetical protein [unclassified Enterococcus]MCA5012559.1 hypothetical protein [Enterococcus sp. S23]MCA5015810.1 hypothetical protein [Enterococcus sp. S22(2020)]